MPKVAEVSRLPKALRDKPVIVDQEKECPPDGLYRLPVTDTVNMRNAGNGIVNEKLAQGWIKPDDQPELLQKSPDGNKFNLVRDWHEVMAERKANNELALRQEGFLDHEMLKDITREDGKTTGAEMEADLPVRAPDTNPDNG